MTESTDKKGPVRVSPKLREWLDEVAADELAKTRRRPSHPELLDRLFVKAQDHTEVRSSPATSAYSYRRENKELHDKLEEILNSGDPGVINAVIPNIEVFWERRKTGATPFKKGRKAG